MLGLAPLEPEGGPREEQCQTCSSRGALKLLRELPHVLLHWKKGHDARLLHLFIAFTFQTKKTIASPHTHTAIISNSYFAIQLFPSQLHPHLPILH